jgi:predicted nucleic acid-binding protein
MNFPLPLIQTVGNLIGRKQMSDGKAFLDTNLFVYLYSPTDHVKRSCVIKVLNQYDCFVSTQVLNEFCNVCLRKLKLPIADIEKAVHEILDACGLVLVDEETVSSALRHHKAYGYSYYDCLMLASALESSCERLFSEDMADGQQIENTLLIKNPFCEE